MHIQHHPMLSIRDLGTALMYQEMHSAQDYVLNISVLAELHKSLAGLSTPDVISQVPGRGE